MSANPDDKTRANPREQFRERLSDIRNQRKGAIAALCVLGGLSIILVTQTQDRLGPIAVFSYGVACGVGAISMLTNVGALTGHKISAEIGLLIAEEVAALRAEVKSEIAALRAEAKSEIAALRDMFLAAVDTADKDAEDEVAQQRHQHH